MSADDTNSLLSMEPHLREAKRMAHAILQMHYDRIEGVRLSEEEEQDYCVMKVLLRELVANADAAVAIFDGVTEGTER